MSLSSGPGEPDHAPIDPDSILEGVVAIDSEITLNKIALDEEDSLLAATESNSNTSIAPAGLDSGSELANPPDGNRKSSQTGLDGTRDPHVEERPGSEDGDQLERAASDSAAAGEEITLSNGNLEFGENIVELGCDSTAPGGRCSVYVVGTAHVSQDSCDEVRAVIRQVKPRVVFLELCASRVAMLTPQKLQVPTLGEMVDMYRTKGMHPFGIIYSWFLARIADKLEIFPGSEFRVAYEEALACGARIMLGDRPVQVTLKRTWATMHTWQKAKLTFAMIFQGFFIPSAEDLTQMVEEMKDTDMITTIIQEMSKTFPSLMDTLVHERDLYMAATLRGVAQSSSTVVAVVGKGHLKGISKNWDEDISIKKLLKVPKRKSSWFSRPVVRWGTVTVAVGGLAVFIRAHFIQKS